VPYQGEIIWARQIRRLLALALEPFEPERALAVLLPVAASFEEVRAKARKICASRRTAGPEAVAEAVHDIALDVHDASMNWIMWRHELVLAFALELPVPARSAFVDETLGTEPSSLKEAVSEALLVYDRPKDAIGRLAAQSSRETFLWLAGHALAEICRCESGSAFDTLSDLNAENILEDLLSHMAEAWPLGQWREGVVAFLRWVKLRGGLRDGWTRSVDSFLRRLLLRVGRQNPVDALAIMDEVLAIVGDDPWERSYVERDIIGAAAQAEPADASLWPFLVERAVKIIETNPRARALEELLSGLRRIDPAARRRCTSLTLGAIGTGPREPILGKLEALAFASLAADPSLAGRGETLVARVAALLTVAPASKPPSLTRALIDDLGW
jgi:hypothetical protein